MNTRTTSSAMLEHVNITVSDPDSTAAMLCRIFGWHVRWKGDAKLGGTTVHVGGDDSYLAVYTLDPDAPLAPLADGIVGGLNHVGIVVDDLDETEGRLQAEGLVTFNHGDYEPGRRFYFEDADKVEYEVVSYR